MTTSIHKDTLSDVLQSTNLKVVRSVTLHHTGEDFSAYNEAEKRLQQEGYTVGSMCYPQPTAAVKGIDYVAKWKNIRVQEWLKIEAMIVGDDYKTEDVTIHYLKG